MWGNIGDRLTSALCKNLITNLLGTVPIGNLPLVNGQIPLVGQTGQGQVQQAVPNVVGGLFGGQRAPSRPKQQQPARRTTPKSNLLDIPFDF